MGAVFFLAFYAFFLGVVYPAVAALVWLIRRLLGYDEKFLDFMSEI